ncbi:type II toxin-antitoxin system RelE/ParE family toxin [Granulicella tundricola]|uniref:Plasmid stabilization system n=1 Tax=Granulicella tundricola (strain ATCC BAA-1859 / DSM 23138 / MP5ACTX9) TaxID=1198114 RepID=E8WVX7_GRATM|nr:type II toxin-antitoxin system RelE/ParE family toxin [Granulicella tundricola]ADW70736.1 plasmid stabilization system [Granulicella tundricola MP5ACTX9]
MRIELSAFIEGDLSVIADFIAEGAPVRAVTFIQEIRACFARIGKDPLLYQLRPDIGSDARVAVVGRYVILFRIRDEIVKIERVLYGGRDLPNLML